MIEVDQLAASSVRAATEARIAELRGIATVGEAATALNAAAVHIDPTDAVFPGHSTDLGAVPA